MRRFCNRFARWVQKQQHGICQFVLDAMWETTLAPATNAGLGKPINDVSCILDSVLSSLMGLPNPAWVAGTNVVSHMGLVVAVLKGSGCWANPTLLRATQANSNQHAVRIVRHCCSHFSNVYKSIVFQISNPINRLVRTCYVVISVANKNCAISRPATYRWNIPYVSTPKQRVWIVGIDISRMQLVPLFCAISIWDNSSNILTTKCG